MSCVSRNAQQADATPVPRFPHPFVIAELMDYGSEVPHTAFSSWFQHSVKNTLELQILNASAAIREKQRWFEKVHDSGIVRKWSEELREQGLPASAIAYLIDEIQYMAKRRSARNGIERATVDGVWMFDAYVAIDPHTIRSFSKAALRLEAVCASKGKDWQPGTNCKVNNLVHPSLYPLVAGLSRVSDSPLPPLPTSADLIARVSYGITINSGLCASTLPTISEDQPNSHVEEDANEFCSTKFQWLPSDVRVNGDGSCDFLSYINNLHPAQHNDLYVTLSEVLAHFIPLFEAVLADLLSPLRRPVEMEMPEMPYGESDESDTEFQSRKEAREPTVVVGDFSPFDDTREPYRLRDRELQVIVKLANTELDEENTTGNDDGEANDPEYEGGVWHVEGGNNERIVATGIYYWDVDNISESRLAFRQAVNTPMEYEQDDDVGVRKVFGFEAVDKLHQNIGSVLAEKGRCVAFPNVYQHRILPFSRLDRSRKGVRKTLVFFLVDPTQRVMSTRRVPPQQREWFEREVHRGPSEGGGRCLVDHMPDDVFQRTMDYLDFPIGEHKAKTLRVELMDERKFIRDETNRQVFERDFSLCEH